MSLNEAYQKALAREQGATGAKVVGHPIGSSTGDASDVNVVTTRPFSTKRGGYGWSQGKSSQSETREQRSFGETCRSCKFPSSKYKCKPNSCRTKCFLCNKFGHHKMNCFKNKF